MQNFGVGTGMYAICVGSSVNICVLILVYILYICVGTGMQNVCTGNGVRVGIYVLILVHLFLCWCKTIVELVCKNISLGICEQ